MKFVEARLSPVREETYGKITPNLDQVMSVKRKGQSKVTIFPDWCKGCGICAAFCPAKVMELNDQGKAVVIREEECINCGFCELHCPDFAIMVQPKVDDEIPAACRALLKKAAGPDAGKDEESIKDKV
jgi:2-oxoglutarate ferredoxin oxidoreductase subunit delta